jgi:AcrR family transcriptional regulator
MRNRNPKAERASRRGKRSRLENASKIQEALVEAALVSISRYGFSKSSVYRITEEAGVGQGTLYSYFGSHQELLKQLLPLEGQRLTDALADQPGDKGGYFEREQRRFTRLLAYLNARPFVLRLLSEAEVAAPEGFIDYMHGIEKRNLTVFRAAVEAGEIRQLPPREFRIIAHMLAGCRAQIGLRQYERGAKGIKRPEEDAVAVGAYLKFVRIGLGADKVPRIGTTRRVDLDFAQAKDRKAQMFEAAGREIAAVGFANTSIKAIVGRAGVAIGTFYSHFEGRDEFLEALLLYARRQVTRRVAEAVADCTSFHEAEIRGFQSLFSLFEAKPWLVWLIAEAAVWAPESYRWHFDVICRTYQRKLRAAIKTGELAAYSDEDLIVLGEILTASRRQLGSLYALNPTIVTPNALVKAYASFVSLGLEARPTPKR